MRLLVATAVLAATLIGGTVGATAKTTEPQSPCENGNPTDLCGDQIDVFDEPPGANCPNGGVKIVVTRPGKPDEVTVLNPPEPPEPVVETFFVCNGADGEPGAPGAPGPTIIGPGGPITISAFAEAIVNVNLGNRRCRSIRERVRLVLPQRFRNQDTVRTKVDRERAITRAVIRNRFVRVNMRGKRCGAHLVQVRKQGFATSLRLWTVTSATGIRKRVLVP